MAGRGALYIEYKRDRNGEIRDKAYMHDLKSITVHDNQTYSIRSSMSLRTAMFFSFTFIRIALRSLQTIWTNLTFVLHDKWLAK